MTAEEMLREQVSGGWRRSLAVLLGIVLSLAAIFALAGRLAVTPAAGQLPALAALGPGKLGMLRAAEPDRQGLPPANIDRIARRALAGSPIAYEPFFGVAAAGFREQGAVGSSNDAKLLREAIRRNPRSREARMLLIRHALHGGNLGEAIDQLAALTRLGGPLAAEMVTGLGKAITTRKQVDEATIALKAHPHLYRQFLRGFSSVPKPRDLVTGLAAQLPAQVLAEPTNRILIMNQLVGVGAYDQARAIWEKASGLKREGLVYSSDFSDAKSPPPFNWAFTEDQTGVAEPAQGGGLAVAYYGRTPGLLLRQLLTLPAGGYQAVLAYRGDGGTPGAIALMVRCAEDGRTIGQAVLDAKSGQQATARTDFTVPPSGCSGQYLSLDGRIMETRSSQNLIATNLTVVPRAAQ